jgi:hypothetical protein
MGKRRDVFKIGKLICQSVVDRHMLKNLFVSFHHSGNINASDEND